MADNEPTWLREAGVATVAGGVILPVLIAVEAFMLRRFLHDASSLGFTLFYAAWTLGALLLLVGLVAVALRTWDDLGVLGIVAVVITALGFLSATWDSLVVNVGAAVPQEITLASGMGFLGTAFGTSLLGLAFLRARLGSASTAALLTAAFPLLVVVLLLFSPQQHVIITTLAMLIFSVPFATAWGQVGRELQTGVLQAGQEAP